MKRSTVTGSAARPAESWNTPTNSLQALSSLSAAPSTRCRATTTDNRPRSPRARARTPPPRPPALRPGRRDARPAAGIDQRSACRHPDWTGTGDLEIKIEELPEITDWPKPIYVKIGATRTFFAVALSVKAGADVITLDGMGGRQRRQARRLHRACRDPDPGGSAPGGALAAGVDMHRKVQLVVSGGIRSGADAAKPGAGRRRGLDRRRGGSRARGQLPPPDGARSPDADPRLRQVLPAQPRARGQGRAQAGDLGDGQGAAGRHRLDPGQAASR